MYNKKVLWQDGDESHDILLKSTNTNTSHLNSPDLYFQKMQEIHGV
jgi:hypothetical protein